MGYRIDNSAVPGKCQPRESGGFAAKRPEFGEFALQLDLPVVVSEPALSGLSRRRVQEPGTSDLRELGEFHAAVAGGAARLAADRASDHEIARLWATLERFASAPDAAGRRRIEGSLLH